MATAACPLCRAHWIPQERGDAGDAVDALPSGASGGGDGSRVLDDDDDGDGGGVGLTSPGGTPYVNLRRYQPGTATGRDLGQYNEFAQRAIERRLESERRKSSGGDC